MGERPRGAVASALGVLAIRVVVVAIHVHAGDVRDHAAYAEDMEVLKERRDRNRDAGQQDELQHRPLLM